MNHYRKHILFTSFVVLVLGAVLHAEHYDLASAMPAQDSAPRSTLSTPHPTPEAQAVSAVIATHRDNLRTLNNQLKSTKDDVQAALIRQKILAAKAGLEKQIIRTRLAMALKDGRLDAAAEYQAVLNQFKAKSPNHMDAPSEPTKDEKGNLDGKGGRS